MSLKSTLRRLKQWVVPQGGIAEQTVKSGMWLGFSTVFNRGLQILLMILLARLLDPSDFGLMGIALLTIGTLKHLTNLGIDEALIQQEDEDVDHYLNTVLSLEVGRAVLISSVVIAGAPFIADFFGEPRATDIVRVVAISPLLMSVKNPGVIYFQKDLDFHKQTLYKSSYSVSRFVVGVVYALIVPSVWALVVSYIVADVVRVAVSYLVHDYRPWPELRLSLAKDLINYGKWITGGSVLYFIYSQGDDAVVGWVLNATSLGFYQLAYQLALAPGTEVSGIIRQVMFPSFSKLQNDIDQLRDAFFRTVQVVTFVGFPAAVGIATVTPTFVRAFLGTDWVPMITTMQLLAIYGLVLTITNTYSPVWKALNRPDYGTKLAAVRVVLIAVLVIPMTQRFGIEGTAMTVAGITVFPMLPLDSYLVINILDSSYMRLARELAYPTVASTVMGACVVGVQRTLTFGSPLLEFVVLVAVGVLTYAATVGVMATQFRWGIDRNLRSIVNSLT
jgi:PST family polysaccharide transporter/lipopolysaccharide exporter